MYELVRGKASREESNGDPLPHRNQIDRTQVLAAALRIADRTGPDSITMRGVAAEVGVAPMSLYHHLPNKEAILSDVAETIAAAALGDPRTRGAWQERARLLFVGLYELVQAHPRALPLITTGVLRTPSGRRWMEELMGVLLEAGFAPETAAEIYHDLGAYTLGLGYAQMLSLEVPAETIIVELAGHWADYPNLMTVGLQLAVWDHAADFATGLDVLLAHFVDRLSGERR